MEGNEAWLSLLQGATRKGCYISGYVDGKQNFDKLLSEFQNVTHSSYNVRNSYAAFHQTAAAVLKGVNRSHLKWSQVTGQLPIEFDGTPFVVCGGNVTYECVKKGQLQVSRSASADASEQTAAGRKRRTLLQKSLRGDCEAYLKVLRVLRLPELAVTVREDLTKTALRRMKEAVFLRAGSCLEHRVVVERFHVLLPTVEAHNGHLSSPLGIAAARLTQRVHPRLIERIQEFVSVGVRDANEVRKLPKLEVSGCNSYLHSVKLEGFRGYF